MGATPKYAERVVGLETEWRLFRTETFPAFQRELADGMKDLGERIDNVSPNGQTPRLIKMGKALGDDAQIDALTAMVESRQRWEWFLAPFGISARAIGVGVLTGVAVIAAHSWVHVVFPAIP